MQIVVYVSFCVRFEIMILEQSLHTKKARITSNCVSLCAILRTILRISDYFRRVERRTITNDLLASHVHKDTGVLSVFRFINRIWATEKLRFNGIPVEARVYHCVPIGDKMGFVEFIMGKTERAATKFQTT